MRKFLQKLRIIVALLSASVFVFTAPSISQSQEGEEGLFLVAQKAFEDGFYDVAVRYIDQFLKDYPQTEKRVEANLLLGQCYFFKNQYLKAYDSFHKLLSESKLKDATLFWLGETYLKGGDYKQAEQHYTQVYELYPKSVYAPQAYYSLGWVYFEQGDFDRARQTFQNLIAAFPDYELSEDVSFKLAESVYNLSQYEEAIQLFKNFVLKYEKSNRHAEAYFYIAEAYYYFEDYLNAITYYAKSGEIAYDNKVILMSKVSLGWSYLKLTRYSQSQQYFDEALAFSKEKGILSDDVFLGQATLFSEMGEPQKALEAYAQLIQNFPNSHRIVEAYLGKANALYLLKKYSEAVEVYQALINRQQDSAENKEIREKAFFGLAWSYLKAGNIDESIKVFESIKGETKNETVKVSALTQIGDAYQDVGQYQKALDVYDQILKEYPDSLYADYVQYRQGVALLKMDQINAATLSFQSLQANFPESKYLNDVDYYLAVAYFKKGEWKAAKEKILDFIKDVNSGHDLLAESQYILALSSFNLDQFDEALKTFQNIIQNFPDQSSMVRNSELSVAKCFYKKGETAEALKRFKVLVFKYAQSPLGQEALIWLGDHYLSLADYDQAIGYFQQFLNEYPGSEKKDLVQYQLAQSYRARRQYDEAVNILKSIGSQDREIFAKAKLAIAEIFSEELDPKSAIETYEGIVQNSPEFRRDAYVKIGQVNQKEKNYEKAVSFFREALNAPKASSESVSEEIQFMIGDTYELLNQPEKAVEEYLKIPYLYSANVPWVVKAYLRVARIFEDQERWEEAQTTYKKILGLKIDESAFAQERLDWIAQHGVISGKTE
jgi:TolA-binding protein